MRPALARVLLYTATALWALGMLVFALAISLCVLAARVHPHLQPPNCWVWAAQEWWRLMRQWLRDGRQPGKQPYFNTRASDLSPWWLMHSLVSPGPNPDSGVMPLESFKPDDPVQLPWWQAWRKWSFEGRVRKGR
jgi:hypothetical protein